MEWLKTPWGHTAVAGGRRYTIGRYRRGDGAGWAYVLRVDGSSLESPPRAVGSLAEAKMIAAEYSLSHQA